MARDAARRLATAALWLALAGASGCGTEVAQTAVRGSEPPVPLDCSAPSVAATLPDDARFGGSTGVSDWILATGDYGADQGPGVAVAALDAYRLFVNGHLLATGTASLVPRFVPLTLLPGDNVIAVVVAAEGRSPALLAELDELERTYGSDATWKVTTAPPLDFAEPSSDDATWDTPADRGAPEDSPGCAVDAGFPSGADAHFITAAAPGTAVFRLDVRIAPIGFAADTTGGADADPVLASTTDELLNAVKSDDPKVVVVPQGVLDVRRTGSDVTQTMACPTPCASDPSMLTYNLLPDDKTCDVDMVPATRDERRIKIGSNTTLVGLGRGALLYGGNLDIDGTKNIIVRNLALFGVNPKLIEAGDGITIDGGDGVWVDHATFDLISDGFIDSTTSSQNLTFSWIKNEGTNPDACRGHHPRSNELSDTTATIHHTLWEHVDGRAPLATHSGSHVHLFDNVVNDDVDYAVGSSCQAEVLLEQTTFESVKYPTAKFPCTAGATDYGLIDAAHGNVYASDDGHHQLDGADAPEPSDALAASSFTYPYRQALDPASKASLLVPVWAGAGARWALPLQAP
jgi:pectate lyase